MGRAYAPEMQGRPTPFSQPKAMQTNPLMLNGINTFALNHCGCESFQEEFSSLKLIVICILEFLDFPIKVLFPTHWRAVDPCGDAVDFVDRPETKNVDVFLRFNNTSSWFMGILLTLKHCRVFPRTGHVGFDDD